MQLNPEMIAGNFLWPLRFSAIPISFSFSTAPIGDIVVDIHSDPAFLSPD
jgi:hypothetical protein